MGARLEEYSLHPLIRRTGSGRFPLCVGFADYDENGVIEITALASGDAALFEMWDYNQDGVFGSTAAAQAAG